MLTVEKYKNTNALTFLHKSSIGYMTFEANEQP